MFAVKVPVGGFVLSAFEVPWLHELDACCPRFFGESVGVVDGQIEQPAAWRWRGGEVELQGQPSRCANAHPWPSTSLEAASRVLLALHAVCVRPRPPSCPRANPRVAVVVYAGLADSHVNGSHQESCLLPASAGESRRGL